MDVIKIMIICVEWYSRKNGDDDVADDVRHRLPSNCTTDAKPAAVR